MNCNQRMTVEARSAVKDTFGGQSSAWSVLDVVWCDIKQLSGSALMAAQALHAEATLEIRMIYDARITAAHRGKYCGRIFEFKQVENVHEEGVETRILASEGVSSG